MGVIKHFRIHSVVYAFSILLALGVGFMLGLLATAVISLIIFRF